MTLASQRIVSHARKDSCRPRITIITPSLNQGRFIERAICSALDQGYENLEYIVIDGGSDDGSGDVIDIYRQDLVEAVIEKDAGESDAINKGLALATGDIVGFLSSDDLYLPGTLEEVARVMSPPTPAPGNGNRMAGDVPAWVAGQCIRIDANDRRLGTLTATAPESLGAYLRHDSGVLPLGATFIRRDLLERFGPFDASLHFAFDYEFFCRLLAAGHRPTVLPQVLAARREHAGSKNATATLRQGLEYIEAAARHAGSVPLLEQYELWVNRDLRRRIYALAEAEVMGEQSRPFMWRELARRPWWLADEAVRRALMHGVQHPVAA